MNELLDYYVSFSCSICLFSLMSLSTLCVGGANIVK